MTGPGAVGPGSAEIVAALVGEVRLVWEWPIIPQGPPRACLCTSGSFVIFGGIMGISGGIMGNDGVYWGIVPLSPHDSPEVPMIPHQTCH